MFIEGLLCARNFLWVSQRNSLANLARQVLSFHFWMRKLRLTQLVSARAQICDLINPTPGSRFPRQTLPYLVAMVL